MTIGVGEAGSGRRRLRLGMVGGGQGAMIGFVHRLAARMEGGCDLVAGCFSSTPERCRASAAELGVAPERAYDGFAEMARKESGRADGIDAVVIVTPNHLHLAAARAFLEAGIDVICDKPMTGTLADARELARIVERTGRVFVLTHNYTGYPMVKQARELVRQGALGEIRKIVAEYPQGWLAGATGISMWRLDPKVAGVSSAVGDIGLHAWHLARYISGLEVESLCADLTTFGKGYELEDDANLLVHYEGGARGIVYSSQMSVGEENGLRVRIFGTKAGLDWKQENPNYLDLLYANEPSRTYKRGNDYLDPIVKHNSRLPFGHPEGFIEAFANIYLNFARTIAARLSGDEPGEFDADFPTVQDGARGVHFIHKAIESGEKKGWVDAKYTPPGA